MLFALFVCTSLNSSIPIFYLGNQEDILSLWNRTADNMLITNRIRDTLRRVLNLPVNAILEYKKHDDCLKFVPFYNDYLFIFCFRDQSSYRHTNPDVSRR